VGWGLDACFKLLARAANDSMPMTARRSATAESIVTLLWNSDGLAGRSSGLDRSLPLFPQRRSAGILVT
jgi:hypothetical protein